MACLERGRAALTAVADLVRTADAKALPDLVTAAQALPDPGGCGDLQSLLANAEPPPAAIAARVAELRNRIAAARVQIAAGRNKEARAIADAVATEARALGYRPLLAETLLVLGHATMGIEDWTAATPPLTEAFTLAFEEGDDSLAIEAWARRAWTRGTSGNGPESLSGLDVVEAAAAKRSVSAFARALLYNNIGSVEIALDDRERARGAFEHALQEARGVTGPGAAELLNVRANLGLTIDDPEQRDRVLAEAEVEKAKVLGADHPETLDTRWLRGRRLMRFAQAAELLPSACAGLELHDKSRAIRCWSEEGYLRRELNDVAAAVSAMQRAESLDVATDPAFPIVLAYLHLWEGDAARATKEFAAALAGLPVSKDEPWWDRYERANLELGLARARRAAGQLREAKAILAQTLETLRDIAAKHSDGGLDRRLGRARAELAEVLTALRAPPAEIAPHAEAAVAWLRQAGGSSDEIRELDRLAGRSGI
jgi:tetratricopeptide (TPR) repeat protein